MKYEEALSILENNPSEEDINRVAREWTEENGFKTIRNAAGREIMAFAGESAEDELPSHFSFKQHAWTKITDSRIVGKDLEFLRNIIETGLKNSEFAGKFVVESTRNGYLLEEKGNEKNSVVVSFNDDGGIFARVIGPDRNAYYGEHPGLEEVIRKIVNRMGDARVVDASGASITYSEPYKVSPILWGVDITDGDNTSTIYARTKEDLLRHVKLHGYEKRVSDAFTDVEVRALPESEVMSIIRKNIPDTAQIHAKRIGTNNYSVSMKMDGNNFVLFTIRWLAAAKLYSFVSGSAIDAVSWGKDVANRITEELNMSLIPNVPKIGDSGIPPVKRMTIEEGNRWNISEFPNFDASGSVRGMREKFYGKDALLVRCGKYIYNVSSKPEIYAAARV